MLKILVATALCALATSASAFSVKFQSSTTGSFFTVATTTAKLTSASLVRIGTFLNVPSSTATAADLDRDFKEFAVSTTGYKSSPAAASDPSKFATATVNVKAGGVNADFLGKKLYLFVYNATTAAAATHAAVFSSNLTAATSPQSTWFFAGDETPGASDLTYGINDLNQAWNGSAPSTTAGPLVLNTIAVPEPASMVFGALGLVGLLARRRR